MVECKTVAEYKSNQEKTKRFCLEEKVKQAKSEEEKVKQARAQPLQSTTSTRQNPVNRRPMGNGEVVAFAGCNQQAQK